MYERCRRSRKGPRALGISRQCRPVRKSCMLELDIEAVASIMNQTEGDGVDHDCAAYWSNDTGLQYAQRIQQLPPDFRALGR